MRSRRTSLERLLRWYPPQWRARYGEEFLALMEDHLAGRRPSMSWRLSVAWAGCHQWSRSLGLVGDSTPRDERTRASTLLVLCAWSVFMLAGAVFAKSTEHVVGSLAPSARALPTIAYDLVEVAGGVGMVLLALGALVAFPSWARRVRAGRAAAVRRPVRVAGSLTIVAIAATVGLSGWAHHLDAAQRNGGDAWYSLVFVAWALLGATSLGSWTYVAVRAAATTPLSARVLRIESVVAVGVTTMMVVAATASTGWCVEVARGAPRLVRGVQVGLVSSAFSPQLGASLALMVVALVAAGYGSARIAVRH